MTTIVEFIEARIAEDEHWATREQERARRAANEGVLVARLWMIGDPSPFPDYPARVLRECEAKRAMIAHSFELGAAVDGEFGCACSAEGIRRDEGNDGCDGRKTVVEILSPFAAIYSDHPDYRLDWSSPAQPPAVYVDQFDRADGTLGASWARFDGVGANIVSNSKAMQKWTPAPSRVYVQLGDDEGYALDPSVEVRAGDLVTWSRGLGENVNVRVVRDDETIYDGLAIRLEIEQA